MKTKSNYLQKGIKLCFLLGLLLCFFTVHAQPLSGTYTIGSSGNYPSIVAAATALNNNGVSGPVIFNIDSASGPYVGRVVLNVISGANSINRITFNGNGAIVKELITNSANRSLIHFNGSDYITLDKLTVEPDAASTYGWGIFLATGSDYNIIKNCKVTVNQIATNTNYMPIILSSAAGAFNANNSNRNIIENNITKGGYYGICVYNVAAGISNSRANIIRNNAVTDFHLYGVYCNVADSSLISANDISRPTRTVFGASYGVYVSGNSQSVIIEKNKIHDMFVQNPLATSTVAGIGVLANDAKMGKETLVRNNVIYNIRNAGISYGIYSSGSDSLFIYHNSISISNSDSTTGAAHGIYQTTAALGVTIKNNNVYVNKAGSGLKYALYLNTLGTTIISDHNNFYVSSIGSGTNGLVFKGSPFYDLATWQATELAAYDQNSVSTDPLYLNSSIGDLRSGSGVVNNKGIPLALVPTDINGLLRNLVNPDIGAYEYTPAQFDAGILEISSPKRICQGINTISVKVKNYAIDTITSLQVYWSVNDTVQPFYSFTGAIPSSQDVSLILGGYHFLPNINYNIKIWSSSPNGSLDANSANDTMVLLNRRTGLVGNYTVGGVGADFPNLTTLGSTLNLNGICGPVRVDVNPAAGPYMEQLSLQKVEGTNSADTILINAHNAEVLFQSTNTLQRHVLQLNGSTYITLDSFIVRTATGNDGFGWGAHIGTGASYNRVTNCQFFISDTTMKPDFPVTTNTSYAGIVFSASETAVLAGVYSYNKFINNTINGGHYGVYLYGTSANPELSKGNEFINNKISNAHLYGMYLSFADELLVSKNEISRMTRRKNMLSNFYGIYMVGNASSSIGMKKIKVEGNRIHDLFGQDVNSSFEAYPIYNHNTDASLGNENLIINNCIYNMNSNGTVRAITNSNSDNCVYYHNTISVDNIAGTGGNVNGLYQDGFASGIQFSNNIISITRGGAGIKSGIYLATSSTLLSSDNNSIYVPVGNVGYAFPGGNGTAYPALFNWQSIGSYDLNSVSEDPVFISAITGNLKPTSSLIDNKGALLPIAVSLDIDGNSRNVFAPDPGAYEFAPFANDVGIIEIVYPSVNLCGSVADSIVLKIKNFGLTSQSNFNVKADITGVINVSLSKTFTGTLFPGTIETVILKNYNSSFSGVAQLKAYAQLQADEFSNNDTLQLQMSLSQPPALPAVNDTFTCRGNKATLIVKNPLEITRWYNSFNDLNPFEIGDTLITPLITQPTTFYVESAEMVTSSFNLGPKNTSIGTAGTIPSASLTLQYLLFTAATDFTLDSVTVYPVSAGNVEIRLLSNTGLVLQTKVVAVTGGGKQRIAVGFTIAAGAYRIDGGTLNTTGGLYRNSNGAFYPYNIPGVASIIGSSFSSASYYYFYDWKITASLIGCPSPRKAVNVTLIPSLSGSTYLPSSLFEGVAHAGTLLNPDKTCAIKTLQYLISPPSGTSLSDLGNTWSFVTTAKLEDGNNTNGMLSINGNQITYVSSVSDEGKMVVFNTTISDISGIKCDTVVKRYLSIVPFPNPNLGKDTTICEGSTMVLNAGVGTSYLWSNGATTPTITVTEAGQYSVRVTNEGNCTDTDTINISLNPAPVVRLGKDTVLCAADGSVLLDAGNPGGIYLWSTGETTRTITVNSTGLYHVMVENLNGCIARDTISIQKNPLPVASINYQLQGGNTVLFSSANAPGVSYLWDFGDGQNSTLPNPTHTYAPGIYTVSLTATDVNACFTSKDTVLNIAVGVQLENRLGEFTAFPNPFIHLAQIHYELSTDADVSLAVYNVQGKKIMDLLTDKHQVQGKYVYSIHSSNSELSNGIYFVRLHIDGATRILKLIRISSEQ